MDSIWRAPAALLCRNVLPGWASVWTLTQAAAQATYRLADALPLVTALDVIYASAQLRAAQDQLEHVDPGLAGRCAAVDLGPLPTYDVSPLAGRLVLDQLITAALGHVRSLEAIDLPLTEAVAAAEVEVALTSALARLNGPDHESRDVP